MNKIFSSVLATVLAAGVIAIPTALWRMSEKQHEANERIFREQAKTNERLVRIETKLALNIALYP